MNIAGIMQVASIEDSRSWSHGVTDERLLFGSLQRWMWCCGAGLLQLQCSVPFDRRVGWQLAGRLSAGTELPPESLLQLCNYHITHTV